MKSPGHEMILASAGSGKTYALTNRFIRLLALGARPERIVALTFTRKAAGEFFDEILRKLAHAAVDTAFAKKIAGEIEAPDFAPEDFRKLLRATIDAMPRLALGTFDSFFSRIVRAFPLELGLGGDFEILQDYSARLERQRVLRRMFARAIGGPDETQREFIEAFKRATFGVEEKRLAARLDSLLDAHHEIFLTAPDGETWGNIARIWTGGCAWFGACDANRAANSLRALFAARRNLDDKQRARLDLFFAALPEWMPGAPLPKPVEYILKNALDVWDAVLAGAAEITIERKKVSLTAEECEALAMLVCAIVGAELTRRIEITRGIHAVLMRYESVYHDMVRRAGRLTFADVQRLLMPDAGAPTLATGSAVAGLGEAGPNAPSLSPGADGPGYSGTDSEIGSSVAGLGEAGANATSHSPGANGPGYRATESEGGSATAPGRRAGGDFFSGDEREDRRLLIDWRLDGQFDHWLLDEFQDTSHGQWTVLRNLIDEAVQDPTGQRTFFYVGDVKQAIYAWREGDARLMREIFEHYNQAAPGSIDKKHRDESQRSGPAILEMVNRVFGDAAALATLFPDETARRWTREWREHKSAKRNLTGQSAWLHADDEDGRFRLALRVIEEIRPLARGLSVAVLVQKNDTATRLADFLRREGGLPAVAESDLHVCTDNPLSAALLALFKAAAHPGDSLAWEHVRMTPLRAALEAAKLRSPDALTAQLLGAIHADGFENTIEAWLQKLEPHLAPDDAFSRERGRQMAEAARLFDATGGRDVAEFIQFMERHTVRDPETASVVRVMTIHKSKGLGFDIVILPDLQGDRLAQRREGLAVSRTPERVVDWVLDLPTKIFHEHDDVLSAHIAQAEADACYDKLALLYVAMTRAKRGMYVITEPVGTSKSHNFPKLLTAALGAWPIEVSVGTMRTPGGFSEGDPNWFVPIVAEETAIPADAGLRAADPATLVRVERRPARTPSGTKSGTVRGATLFATTGASSSEFGTAVHDAFAAVEWWNPAHAEAWAAALRGAGIVEHAIAEARACLDAPALAEVFLPPAAGKIAEVWRERAFEIVLDGAWVTGVFDRVVLTRDRHGRVARAAVYDFKTDRVGGERAEWTRAAARYAGQMHFYRRAAATLAGIAAERVSCAIVLTGAIDAAGARIAPIALEPPGLR